MAPSPISIKLRCTSWKQLAALYERDLTRNAVFLKSSAPPPLGTSVRINLTLPTQVLIIMRGVVHAHVGPGGLNGRGPGVDIQLQQVPEDAMATIEAALASAKRDVAAAPPSYGSNEMQPPVAAHPDSASSPAGHPANGTASPPLGDAAAHEEQAPVEHPSPAPGAPAMDDDLVLKLRQELESLRKLNPFQILGVGYETTDEAVNRAFASLSKRYHPDRFASDENGEAREIATAIFSLIRHAYRGLNSAENRALSLKELEERRAQANGSALASSGEEDAAAVAPEPTPTQEQYQDALDAGSPASPMAPEDDEGISLFDSIMTSDEAAEATPQPADEGELANDESLAGLDELGDSFDEGFGDRLLGDESDADPGDASSNALVDGHEEAAPHPFSDDGAPIDIEVEDPDGPSPYDRDSAVGVGLGAGLIDEDAFIDQPVPMAGSESDSSSVQLAIDDPTPIPPPSPIGGSDEEREDAISDDLIDAIPLDDDASIELLDDDALAEAESPESIDKPPVASKPRSAPPPLPVPGSRPAPPPIPGARRSAPVSAPEPEVNEIEPTPAPSVMAPEPEVQAAPSSLLEPPDSHLAALQIDDVADDSVGDGVDDASEDALDHAFADPLAEPSTMGPDESSADDSSDGSMEEALDDDRPTWLGMAAEPRFAEAFGHIRDGKYREALTVYRVALRRDPDDRAARVGVELTEGLKALEERDRMEAAQRFELVLELDPGNQRAAEAIAEMRQQAAAERKEHLAKLRNQQD